MRLAPVREQNSSQPEHPSRPPRAARRADCRLDRGWRGAVSTCSETSARRLSADNTGRAVAGPYLLGLEHAGLWRRDNFRNRAGSLGDGCVCNHNSTPVGWPSVRELKPLEPMQLLLDAGFKSLPGAPRRTTDPVPILHKQLAILAIGFEIERGDDVFAD